jgi:DNA-binding CsgD family transcriptional regulator
MSLDEDISRLIQRVYCAGGDTVAWDSVAEQVLRVTGARAGLTTVVDLKNREFSSYRFYGPDDSACARGMEEYAHIYAEDPTLIWASNNPAARFCDSSKSGVEGDYLKNAFIRWNRARFGSTHWYVGYTEPEDELSFSFSVHFPAEQGPGTQHELNLFRLLFDHLECAVRLGRRPFNAESERSLILLDAGGWVRSVSSGAQLLLRKPGAIAIQGARVVTTCAAEQAALDKALGAALDTVSRGTLPQAIHLHPPQGRPWIIVIRPLLSSYGPFGQIRCELLLEIHEGLPRIGSIDLLQSLYDLTGREMQVIRLLADGHSLESLAQCMDISPNTARTHLRAIFTKTATTRQSELMHLCAGLSQAG